MLSNTEDILNKMGVEYVRRIKLELGVVRKRTSKITGKNYKARYNNTGSLTNSLKHEVKDEKGVLALDIKSLDYFDSVVYGTPRKSQSGNLATWIETKPYRFRASNGRIIPSTPARVQGFANFLSTKLDFVGSDLPSDGKPFMDEINESIQSQYLSDLPNAIALDVADDITNIFKDLNDDDSTRA